MAALVGQTASQNHNNTTTNQVVASITPGAGETCGVAVVFLNTASGVRTINTVVWNGVAMTPVTGLINQGSMGCRIYILNGIGTGSAVDVQANMSAATQRAIVALSVSGVDPTVQNEDIATGFGNADNSSVTVVNSTTDSVVIGGVIQASNGVLTEGANQTPRANAGWGPNANWMVSSEVGGASTVHSYSWPAAQDFSTVAVSIRAEAGATPVGRNVTSEWNILAGVGRDISLVWDIIEAVGRDATYLFDILAAAGRDMISQWNITAAVGRSAAYLWNIRAAVGRSATYLWDIKSAIGRSIASFWHIGDEAHVTLIASDTNSGSSRTTATITNVKVGQGSGLQVHVYYVTGSVTASTVTWNGNGMTKQFDKSGFEGFAVFTLTNATGGTGSVVITMSGNTQFIVRVFEITQTIAGPTAIKDVQSAEGNASATAIPALAGTVGGIVVGGCLKTNTAPYTIGADQTPMSEISVGTKRSVSSWEWATASTTHSYSFVQARNYGAGAVSWSPSLTAVGRSVSYLWNILQTVGKNALLEWGIIAAVGRDVVSQWNILATAARNLASTWHIGDDAHVTLVASDLASGSPRSQVTIPGVSIQNGSGIQVNVAYASGAVVTAITWGGTALDIQVNRNLFAVCFAIGTTTNVTGGSGDIVVSLDAGTNVKVYVYELTNVEQSTAAVQDSNSDEGNGTATSIPALTGSVGGIVVGGVAKGGTSTIAVGAGQTQLHHSNFGTGNREAASWEPSDLSVTHSYSWSGAGDYATGAVAWKQLGGSGGVVGRDLASLWDIIAAIGRDSIYEWDIQEIVSVDSVYEWDILGLITVQRLAVSYTEALASGSSDSVAALESLGTTDRQTAGVLESLARAIASGQLSTENLGLLAVLSSITSFYESLGLEAVFQALLGSTESLASVSAGPDVSYELMSSVLAQDELSAENVRRIAAASSLFKEYMALAVASSDAFAEFVNSIVRSVNSNTEYLTKVSVSDVFYMEHDGLDVIVGFIKDKNIIRVKARRRGIRVYPK